MKNKNLQNKILYVFGIGVSIVVFSFIVTTSWIGFDVKQQCEEAINQYEGDLPAQAGCVEALMQTVASENESLRDRNEAIWALGQLGDDRALPLLQEMYTGNIPDREPYDETISQYELRKAIKLLEGEPNITAFTWRYNLPQ